MRDCFVIIKLFQKVYRIVLYHETRRTSNMSKTENRFVNEKRTSQRSHVREIKCWGIFHSEYGPSHSANREFQCSIDG